MTIGVFYHLPHFKFCRFIRRRKYNHRGAAIAATCIYLGFNPFIATLLALWGGGMLAGLATGLLHTQLKIPALLAGILTMIGLYSVNLRIMGRANISLLRLNTIYTPFQQNLGLTKAVIITGFLAVLTIIGLLYWFWHRNRLCPASHR